MLDKYGADTLRFTLTALLNPGRDVKLSENRVKGYKSFTNKIWNASNFLLINNCKIENDFNPFDVKLPINQWLINELASTNQNISKYMSKYLFHEVANEIYHFIWDVYCNWYVEFAKSLFQANESISKETKSVSMWAFKEILKLSHPTMPFITEKLWSKHFNTNDFLMNEIITEMKIQKNFNLSQSNFKRLIDIIISIRNLRSELNIPYKNLIKLNINNNDNIFILFLNSFKNEIIRLLKLEDLSFNNEDYKSKGSANIIFSSSTLIIPLKGVIDTKNEIQKLLKRKIQESDDLKKLLLKLENPNFINKAPKDVVTQFKKQAEKINSSIVKIDQIINTIK